MARLAVLIDRPPRDSEWKGAVAWNIILSLAESQHEVLALTTCELGEIDIDHPRLNVARPAPSFGLQHLPKWLRAIFQFQPEVVHTFALRPVRGPRALTVWPMLEGGLSVLPRVRRFSTALSDSDLLPFSTVSPPLELPIPSVESRAVTPSAPRSSVLIPAPVSEWHGWQGGVLMLNEFLQSNRQLHVEILGGWGDLSLSERRTGWRLLEHVNQQVHMRDSLSFEEFVAAARSSGGLWLRGLRPTSWRALVAAHVVQEFGLPTWGDLADVRTGSTANFLSRLYSSQ
jgi:hypothetical protein